MASASDSSSSPHGSLDPYLIAAITATTVAALGVGVYISGAGDDVAQWIVERFFKAKARAEEKALEHVGAEKVQGFLKDQLKKNPVVSDNELKEVAGELGE